MTDDLDLSQLPADENVIVDYMGDVNPADLSSLTFKLDKYQQFHETMPTVVLTYVTGQLGVVTWNLAPGQENDYHMHPNSEHLHIILKGECEYQVADQAPVTVGVGEAVMVPAGVAHGIRNVTDEPASYIAIVTPGPYEKVRVERPGV